MISRDLASNATIPKSNDSIYFVSVLEDLSFEVGTFGTESMNLQPNL